MTHVQVTLIILIQLCRLNNSQIHGFSNSSNELGICSEVACWGRWMPIRHLRIRRWKVGWGFLVRRGILGVGNIRSRPYIWLRVWWKVRQLMRTNSRCLLVSSIRRYRISISGIWKYICTLLLRLCRCLGWNREVWNRGCILPGMFQVSITRRYRGVGSESHSGPMSRRRHRVVMVGRSGSASRW